MTNQASKDNKSTSFIGLLISMVLPIVLLLFVLPKLPNLEAQKDYVGLGFIWLSMLLLVAYLLKVEKRDLSSIGLKKIGVKQIFIAIGLGVLLSLLIPLVYTVMPMVFEVENLSLDTVSDQSKLIVFLGVLTAAITEEVLFRSYPLERIKELTNSNVLGVIISVGLFCILHSESWNIAHILGAVLPLGLALSIIYLKTRNLIFVMIVHFMIDLPILFL